MNKFVKEQLNKCRVANIPQFDDATTNIKIVRNDTTKDILQLNNYYLIEVLFDIISDDTIRQEIFDRSGYTVQSRFMKCAPTKFEDGWTKFDCSGYEVETQTDLTDVYLGLWLPRNSYRVVSKLK